MLTMHAYEFSILTNNQVHRLEIDKEKALYQRQPKMSKSEYASINSHKIYAFYSLIYSFYLKYFNIVRIKSRFALFPKGEKMVSKDRVDCHRFNPGSHYECHMNIVKLYTQLIFCLLFIKKTINIEILIGYRSTLLGYQILDTLPYCCHG